MADHSTALAHGIRLVGADRTCIEYPGACAFVSAVGDDFAELFLADLPDCPDDPCAE
ncbi:MAG: hypothetical protein R3B89_35495 [Polyangiaceae bacterium]